jgi:predicted nuclease with TOPRIM domain
MASEEANSISSDNLPNLSNTKEEAQELNKIPYVKDLLVKIDVLKKGIIGERKKNSALSAQNKQLETEINTKENEIRKLCKEKVDLENQLQLEKKKLAKKEESFLQMANAFGKSSAINNTNKFGLQINFLKKMKKRQKKRIII